MIEDRRVFIFFWGRGDIDLARISLNEYFVYVVGGRVNGRFF